MAIDATVYFAPRGDGGWLACAPRGLAANEVLDDVRRRRRDNDLSIQDDHQICPTDGSRRHWMIERQ